VSRAYGWSDDGKTIVDTEADELRNMARHLLDGGTLRGLVDDVAARNVPTATGKTWQSITIKRALLNPRIIGMRDVDGELQPGDAPPILDEDTYDKLVALLKDPARARFTADKTRVHLLSGGVVRCGTCGSQMYANIAEARPGQYKCSARSGGCGRVSVLAGPLEADVTERVMARLSDAVFRRRLTDAINELGQPESMESEVAALEHRLAALGEDYAEGLIERSALHAGTAKARSRIEFLRLQAARRELLQDIPEPDVDAIIGWWEEASKARRRDVVAVLLDHVTVLPATRRGSAGVDPDRLKWEWQTS
jgi:hypothetical protein